MESLPDLDCLSVADKDALIGELWPRRARVVDLSAQVADLTAKVTEMHGRLAKNRGNSSKPPSSDGLNKPQPKLLRTPGLQPTGGQKGHAVHTLKRVAQWPSRIGLKHMVQRVIAMPVSAP